MPRLDPGKTLLDPWIAAGQSSTRPIPTTLQTPGMNKRARSSAYHYCTPTNDNTSRSGRIGESKKHGDSSWITDGRYQSVLDKYEVSVAKAVARKTKGTGNSNAVPDMHIWAKVLGIDIESSKATARLCRRTEEPDGRKPGSAQWARWAPASSTFSPRGRDAGRRVEVLETSRRHPPASQRRKRGCFSGIGGGEKRSATTEVVALDGFLSDLQGRLCSIEGAAVGAETTQHAFSNASDQLGGGSASANGPEAGAGGRGDDKTRDVDVYGVPRALMTYAEEVREMWHVEG